MTRWILLAASSDPLEALAAQPADGDLQYGADLEGSTGGRGWNADLRTGAAGAGSPPDCGPEVEAVALGATVARGHSPLPGRRVKRTLLLRVLPGTAPGTVARLEADLVAMPEHIPAIRSWSLSRVDRELSPGSRWTHAWEQEFADPQGLIGDYLLHPYHWTCVDRWFDPELPQHIVHPQLAHLFRWTDGPVLGPSGR